ncbi:hypothetical protein PDJAM_G00176680 [Pangasius djambal]|uniref:Uncharacterized protein n=1 Tax=Pangasius djambal TaxID=1691987 RepID=A0ACC5ZQ81_9TELE|nr:hypothetical protein [Pangasius djambal]
MLVTNDCVCLLRLECGAVDSVLGDEDLTFGSYQPTLGSTPEGRTSRRHSVRFSTEDISSPSPEHKPKSSTTSTVISTRPGRPASDWLGLKQEDVEVEKEEEPKREKKEATGASEKLKPLPSPSHVGGKPSRGTLKPTEEPVPDSPETSTTTAAKSELKNKEEEDEDDWLAGALNKKKALVAERERRQEESLGLGEERDLDTFLSKQNTTSTPRRVKEDTPLPPRQPSRESLVASSRQQSPAPTTGAQHTHEPEQKKPAVVSAAPVQQVSLSTDGLQQFLLQQQLAQAQLWGLGTPLDLSSLQKQRRDTEHHTGDTTALQTRIIQLEGQVRSLQLEKDQLQMLLDNVQQRHKHDTELMENAHRARVKLLEECAGQREARAHMENQELTERLEAVMKLVQQERAELQEQHQRRLAQSQQERDREVERLRELQRSLMAVIEQMEQFSLRLGDLSSRIESTHENTTQGLELGARQRDEQLRVLQERLSQQQRDMVEERTRLKEVIAKMDTQLAEQQRQLQQERLSQQQRDMVEERTRLKEVIAKMDTQLAEQQRQLQQERWRVTAEQAKAESALRGLEEERRTMTQHFTIEREELERAKSALLEEQQSVMQRCAEERRKLAAEWTHFHTQDKLRKERETDREGHIISMAQEQAELKLRAGELKQREEAIQKERENLEKLRGELEGERERLNAAALHLKHRAQEVERLSKLACERYEEGERALQEARQVEAGHQARLRSIHTELERLRTQEHNLQQERMRMTDYHREVDRIRHSLPTDHIPAPVDPLLTGFSPVFNSTAVLPPAPLNNSSRSFSPKLQATLAVLKHTAEKDRDFLQDEQLFLDTLKRTPSNSTLQT